MKKECQICCESSSNYIKCLNNKCKLLACKLCIKKYLLDSEEEIPRCMSCKNEWSKDFMYNNLPSTWIFKEYKIHRENILNNKYKALEQEYTKYVISNKRIQKYREIKNFYSFKLTNIMNQIDTLINQETTYVNELNIEQPIDYTDKDFYNDINVVVKKTENETENIIKGKCPSNTCNGYIGNKWLCTSCDSYICYRCLEIRSKEINSHECDPNIVENIKLIKKDSKECPKCQVRVYRYEGCPQMWCTNCKTFFNWNTLKILDNKHASNPHYTEYLNTFKEQSVKVIDTPVNVNMCNFSIENFTYLTRLIDKNSNYYLMLNNFINIFRYVNEILTYYADIDIDVKNIDKKIKEVMIKYLTNEISLEQRKKKIQELDKKKNKEIDTKFIRLLWAEQMKNILYNFYKHYNEQNINHDIITSSKTLHNYCKECIHNTITSIKTLHNYCKECMFNISKWYKNTEPNIRPYNSKYSKNLIDDLIDELIELDKEHK